MAQLEHLDEFDTDRVMPVYLSFVKSSLLQTSDENQFSKLMIARICVAILRSLKKKGVIGHLPSGVGTLAGSEINAKIETTRIEKIASAYEDSWKEGGGDIDVSSLPSVEELKHALEDLAEELEITRFALFIDEAAHIFLPQQQRQFFTLFRDLRCPILTCNAAIYPGVTSFGDSFQPSHDATMLTMERDILATNYVENMREIVMRQADSTVQKKVIQNGENFAVLAYAATGNPRVLLKTVASAPNMNSTQVNEVVREFYRNGIWAEHTTLAEKYEGHRAIIDWGRNFIEKDVLPEISRKNSEYLGAGKNTSAFFWIHKDAPQIVKEALHILAYTGVVVEQEAGMRASRSEIGQRHMVNLGCLFALEARPATTAFEIASELTPKRMTEFGANHSSCNPIVSVMDSINIGVSTLSLQQQMDKSIDVLDLTQWQKEKLRELNLLTVGAVFDASETQLIQAHYVGYVRARTMRNAAEAAVLEYLSG